MNSHEVTLLVKNNFSCPYVFATVFPGFLLGDSGLAIWPSLGYFHTSSFLVCTKTADMFLSGITYCVRNSQQHHLPDYQFFLILDLIC